jgi:mono/diheme cytochrome c family protein
MKRSTLVIAAGLALLGLGMAIAVSVLHDGLSARATPSKLETVIARSARRLAIPSNARTAQSPVPASEEDMRDSLRHYADHCAICHANDGSGDTEIGRNLYPKPPDMRVAETQKLTDGELFYIISSGVRLTGMPGWGDSHGKEDTWKLVLFIRHLPQLSEEEKKEMERFNPKGADEHGEEEGHHHHDP